jgi:hypothetical protein
VLVVTHDPRIVPFAKRIVRIEDGSIVGEDRRSNTRGTGDGHSLDEEQAMIRDMEQDLEDESSIKTKRMRMQR